MVSLKAALRHQAILARLQEQGEVSITGLSSRLAVTTVTIRDDLRILEASGQLRCTDGGALPPETEDIERSIDESRAIHSATKLAIGRQAASMIRPRQKLILDAGSTTFALAKSIPENLPSVTVITNCLSIAQYLATQSRCVVVVTGGTVRPKQHSLVAPLGSLLLERLYADIAFIGCHGIDLEQGITHSNPSEAAIKQVIMKSAERTILLADSSKFGRVASQHVADLSAVSLIITDDGVDTATLQQFEAAEVAVQLVPRQRSKLEA